MPYYRRIIRVRADDSPNVRLALAEIAKGQEPSGKILVPGVISWDEYQKRMETWDRVKICIGMYGEFYEGSELLLFPPDWLTRANILHQGLVDKVRKARAIGVDPAEGGDRTVICVVDDLGLIELESIRTPDTSIIPDRVATFMRKYSVPASMVVFDRGGGGKEHADRMRSRGLSVRSVGFGESVLPPVVSGRRKRSDVILGAENRYVYKNRRAEMYGTLHLLMEPSNLRGFALPAEYTELRRQLSKIPLLYDPEGCLFLPPKNKRSKNSQEKTLTEILGCSPDEADALVLAVHALTGKVKKPVAGAI